MPFIAGAGVAVVAIGFAAKDTLSNLIAGILLIIDRPFEVGDRIEVWSAPAGTSTWGDVIDIGCTRFHILPTGLKQRLMGRELRSRIQNGIFTLKGRFDEVFVTGYWVLGISPTAGQKRAGLIENETSALLTL